MRTHDVWRLFVLAGGLSLGALAPSLLACVEPNPDHCVHNGGDAFCQGKHGEAAPYCSDGTCVEAPADGCVAAAPTGCWSCDGVDGDNGDCDAMAEGDGDGDPTSGDGDGEGDGDGDTTGDGDGDLPACVDSSECADTTPLCDGGACVSCAAATETDCATALPSTPVCEPATGACVLCSADNDDACSGTTPICEDNACVACTEHEQCPDSACNLSSGACLATDRVWWVDQGVAVSGDGTQDSPFESIQEALDLIGDGQEGTIIVATAGPHLEQVQLFPGQTAALLGANGDAQIQSAGSIILLNSGSTLFAKGLRLTNGTTGISCTGGAVWFDDGRIAGNMGVGAGQGVSLSACDASFRRSAIVNNTGGGITFANGGTLALENVTVGGSSTDVVAVAAGNGDVDIVYTTLAASFGASALSCTGGGGNVVVRNSLLVSRDTDMPVLAGCDSASINFSALETAFGSNNVAIGEMSTTWFDDWASGELTLSGAAPAELATAASWDLIDPATDIDGDLRPTEDSTPDYAGADIP